MAKPFSVAFTGGANSSKSHRGGAQNTLETSHRPRHRRHRTSKPSPSTLGPSSSLLSILATIASASTSYASPAPPPFLCPSIQSHETVERPLSERASSSTTVRFSNSATVPTNVRRHVPAKFEKGADGIWRRVESYTLYGSTVPSGCTGTDCRLPTNAVSTIDDQIQVGGSLNTSNTTTTPYDIRNELPPGWKPTVRPYEGRTTLILALSLVLACFICFFIIGCLFWRKNLKKKRTYADVEARSRRRRHRTATEEEAREMEMEREIKTKQKIWARATARWKANVRYSAHQRRGKRRSTRLSQAQQSTASLDNSRSRLAGSASSTHSRASSRRSSLSSLHDQLRHDEVPATTPSASEGHVSRPETPQLARAASPPAYQRGQNPPIVVSSDECTEQSGLSTAAHFDLSRRPSHSSLHQQKADHLFSAPTPIHAAHVATDDKSLLARLADLVSAPPEDASANPAGMSDPQVSAPAWQDEELEGYTHDLTRDACVSDGQSPPLSFPPPPSKERLAAAERYEYSFAFEEMDSLEPEDEPSAPPFEDSPPPIDESVLLPSAPPLLDDESGGLSPNSIPSAPEWDSPTDGLESSEENLSGQDHDRIPSMPTNSPASRPPTTRPINEAVGLERNASTDIIMLPDYKP